MSRDFLCVVNPALLTVKLNGFPVYPVKADGANVDPPTEFMLFPAGEHTSEKGSFTFNAESAKAVLERAAEKGNDIPIDYEHLMLEESKNLPGDGPTPSAGWFNLEVREGALWAVNVKWTDRARNYLKQKEYRFMSPAFRHTKEGVIRELVNCALVNLPAQHNQTPLVAAKDDGKDVPNPKEPAVMEHLLAKLKLSKSASETEAVEVVTTILSEREKMLAALSAKDVGEAVGVIAALKQVKEQHAELQKEMLTIKAAERQRKVERLVEQGLKEKKIAPAMKEDFIAQGMQKDGIKFLKKYLETAAPLVALKQHKAPKSEDGDPAADDTGLKVIAQKMGIKLEDLKKQMGVEKAS